MYEIFEHTADLGLHVSAPSFEQLCVDAARGLFSVIAGDLVQIQADKQERVSIAGTEPVWLLFDMVSELHAAFELRRMLFSKFQVSVDAAGLEATAWGEPYDPAVHSLAHEIKAITQHGLDVQHDAAGWRASLIMDV